jgi:hypothetical protein
MLVCVTARAFRLLPGLPVLFALALAGCHAPSLPAIPTPAAEQHAAAQQAEVQTQREQLNMIPPPSKSRYMIIHSFESWENPYITVQPSMLELHVLIADANTSDVGAGGMMRPVGARRQVLMITPENLGEAVASIPQSSWPYGRVLAIEEAHKTPKDMEPTVRRTMEVAVNKLNDLGVEAYDPIEGSLR